MAAVITMPRLQTKVAGTTFRDVNKGYLQKLAERPAGRYPKCKLVRDPENRADPNAVKVYAGNKWVGFLPRDVAARVAEHMDAGTEVTARIVTVELWAEHPTSPSMTIEVIRP